MSQYQPSDSNHGSFNEVSFFDRRLPIILRPNRGPNLVNVLVFIGVMGFILYQLLLMPRSFFAFDMVSTRPVTAWFSSLLPVLIYLAVIGTCIFTVWRELVYFRPRGSYYLQLSKSGLVVSTPITLKRFEWESVERFRVEQKREQGKGGSRMVYIVQANLRDGGTFNSALKLRQLDFAKDLGHDKENSAEILCAFLNEVRDRVREAERFRDDVVASVPYGLVVDEASDMAEQPAGRPAKPKAKAAKTVERKPTIIRD